MFALVMLVGCGSRAPAPPPEDAGPMTTEERPATVTGERPIDDALIAWLDAEAGRRTLQMPVEVHQAVPSGVERAVLRGRETAIDIELDTTTLSMTFEMHLEPHCPASPCTVWIEGTWGSTLSFGPPAPTLTVRKVLGPVEGEPGLIR
ncbi:MAG: hypothetical protein H6736_25055, partial [Alphaproteobacteria bacterium]|nr:hypothetical protein [Alphaproteobacteria bacterium]